MEARRSAVDCLVDEGRAREIDGHVTRAGRTGAVGRDAPGSPQRRARVVSKQAKDTERGRKSTVFKRFQAFSRDSQYILKKQDFKACEMSDTARKQTSERPALSRHRRWRASGPPGPPRSEKRSERDEITCRTSYDFRYDLNFYINTSIYFINHY